MKQHRKLLALVLSLLLLSGCGSSTTVETAQEEESTATTEVTTSTQEAEEDEEEEAVAVTTAEVIDTGDMFTDRDLDPSYAQEDCIAITLSDSGSSCTDSSVEIQGSTITITEEGVYLLSGKLSDGMIIVEADSKDKVQLVLDGVEITCASSAAIYVRNADKVFITLAEGSENSLATTGEYVAIDENNIDAVIFSKDDLTLNGYGTVTIQSEEGHGVVSKDDLKVTGGTWVITAASHALSGKDSVRIADGTLVLTAGKDGIHAENDDDESKGYVYLAGGSYTITAEGDGISAGTYLQIEAGTYVIETGGGSENASSQSYGQYYNMRGMTYYSMEESSSTKGLKAGEELLIHGGTFTLDCQDDAIHGNADVSITGGTFTIATGDDGIHADDGVTLSNATIDITTSYEGIEGTTIDIFSGTITLVASDDGLNAAGGTDSSGFGGWSQDIFSSDGSSCITISGGVLTITAAGDGIDSNGDLYVTGGLIYVFGPTDSSNGALDHGGDATISGGVLVATSCSSMEEIFESGSEQGCMMISLGTNSAGTEVTLTDSDGNVLVSFTAPKTYSRVIISCPELTVGGTYTLTSGSTSVDITLSSLIYTASASSSSMGGGMQSQGGQSSGRSSMGGRR